MNFCGTQQAAFAGGPASAATAALSGLERATLEGRALKKSCKRSTGDERAARDLQLPLQEAKRLREEGFQACR